MNVVWCAKLRKSKTRSGSSTSAMWRGKINTAGPPRRREGPHQPTMQCGWSKMAAQRGERPPKSSSWTPQAILGEEAHRTQGGAGTIAGAQRGEKDLHETRRRIRGGALKGGDRARAPKAPGQLPSSDTAPHPATVGVSVFSGSVRCYP